MATFASVFTVFHSLRFIRQTVFGSPPHDLPEAPHESARRMRLPVEPLVLACIAIGLVPDLTHERVHAPTLGMALILAASIPAFSVAKGVLVLRDLPIGLFLTVTTPATPILVGRAAAFRDRSEGDADAPPDP